MLDSYASESIYIVGDGYAVAHKTLSAMGIRLKETPILLRDENAYSVAKVAARLHAKGETTDDLQHLPTYLRVPQAERERLERLNNEKN